MRQRPGRRPSAVPLPRQHPRRPGVRRRVSADGPAERLGQQGLLEVVAPALVVEGGEEEAVELEEVAWALGGLGDAVGTSAGGRSGGESRCRRGGAAAVCVGDALFPRRPASSAPSSSAAARRGSPGPDERRRQRSPPAHEAEERPLRGDPGAELPWAHGRERRRLSPCRRRESGPAAVAVAGARVLLVEPPLQHGRWELPPALINFF